MPAMPPLYGIFRFYTGEKMLVQQPREFLRHVYTNPFALPAFNVCNLEMAKAVLEAAVAERAPVIVQTYPGDLAHAAFGSDLGALPALIRAMAMEAPVPVILHLDHGPGLEFNLRCLRAGYNSVMYDGHDLPLEFPFIFVPPLIPARSSSLEQHSSWKGAVSRMCTAYLGAYGHRTKYFFQAI